MSIMYVTLLIWFVILYFQVVVITGASSGIGEALAHAFYEQGSKVVLAARRKTELERVKNDLMSKNLVCTFILSLHTFFI